MAGREDRCSHPRWTSHSSKLWHWAGTFPSPLWHLSSLEMRVSERLVFAFEFYSKTPHFLTWLSKHAALSCCNCCVPEHGTTVMWTNKKDVQFSYTSVSVISPETILYKNSWYWVIKGSLIWIWPMHDLSELLPSTSGSGLVRCIGVSILDTALFIDLSGTFEQHIINNLKYFFVSLFLWRWYVG